MRLGQPKEERRTWPKHFLSLVREISPAYSLNKLAKGSRTECLRELAPGGLLASHNTFCLRGGYSHCFGLTLSPALSDPFMRSPFFIGGRFDHNLSIAMSFMRHMGLTPDDRRHLGMSWHDTHEWRVGTDDIVRRCTRTAEEHLIPFYLARVAAARDNLRALLDVAASVADLPDDEIKERCGPVKLEGLDLSLFEIADPGHAWQRLPVPQRYVALVMVKRTLFAKTRQWLPEMLKRLESVRAVQQGVEADEAR